ncbi:MAG: hypothetical protein LBJ02_04500 [Bifidobacteriaceae bacterium]|jgi:hypothetical protein|nr:hypothetical protein [Bifidobacteriaceae bacterium]
MSFGMHVAAAVISVGGALLVNWLGAEKKTLVGLCVAAGIFAGMWGLSQVADADKTALLLWFVFGVSGSVLVWTVRDVVVWYRRKRAAAGQPQPPLEPTSEAGR